MREIAGTVFVSLDGVMQAPGGPEEDGTGGFELGGWLWKYFDAEVDKRLEDLFAGPFDLLLGRRTYDIFAAYWPFVEGENKSLGDRFDRASKYVVTRGAQPLPWQNSHRMADLDAVAEMKSGDGPPLIIQGSSTLYPQLLAAGLIDRLTLMIFPLLLGSGKRVFGDGTHPGSMRMTAHQVTSGGTIIATYEPDGAVEPGSFQTIEPTALERERQERIAEGSW
jgi:dihydrofolate reductase